MLEFIFLTTLPACDIKIKTAIVLFSTLKQLSFCKFPNKVPFKRSNDSINKFSFHLNPGLISFSQCTKIYFNSQNNINKYFLNHHFK
jgi:hypothetical protein